MGPDQYTFLFTFASSVAGIFVLIKYIPICVFLWKANALGMQINWISAKKLYYPTCLKKDFLLSAIDIMKMERIDIELLSNHYLIGGKMENVANGLHALKRANVEYDLKDVFTLDLLGWTLNEKLRYYQKDGKFDLTEALIHGN